MQHTLLVVIVGNVTTRVLRKSCHVSTLLSFAQIASAPPPITQFYLAPGETRDLSKKGYQEGLSVRILTTDAVE